MLNASLPKKSQSHLAAAPAAAIKARSSSRPTAASAHGANATGTGAVVCLESDATAASVAS